MLGLIRLLVFCFLLMSIIYLTLYLYLRTQKRASLDAEWDASKGPRHTYINDELQTYVLSLRKKLILGVYVVPTALLVLWIYITNFA